jgi:hypothetical protein
MSAATVILEQARHLGVSLRLAGDKIKVKGPKRAVEEIVPVLREHKPEVMAALADPAPTPSIFQWLPLDQENAREALEERIGIPMADGMPEAEAVREAGWHLERARCWERFQSHATIITTAFGQDREALLEQYRLAATRVFGREIAGHMAETVRSWVTAKSGD